VKSGRTFDESAAETLAISGNAVRKESKSGVSSDRQTGVDEHRGGVDKSMAQSSEMSAAFGRVTAEYSIGD